MDDAALAEVLRLDHIVEADTRDPRSSIIFELALEARAKAIEATRQLLTADPAEPKNIMRLQNEAARYREIAIWVRTVRGQATEAWDALDPDEQEQVASFLANPEDERTNDA